VGSGCWTGTEGDGGGTNLRILPAIRRWIRDLGEIHVKSHNDCITPDLWPVRSSRSASRWRFARSGAKSANASCRPPFASKPGNPYCPTSLAGRR
jgi:hypothetical protein